ncbi:uncharacterized protein EDB91DRAFT_1091642 [Suillus paluster]|uniref:uncharacterized protein n=1 Tax=Suillus paluster TaxID=48578 RepID=UPI001B87AA92|nr:uncharacterized protein EDB91DRAFT_1091642 [Suillus paluster]KAG1756279.1 hypothetical protein EDB91DRAFT_1091642 [Suillus paluster]
MPEGPSRNTRKGRSVSLHIPKQCDPTPVPPSLADSPHLSSPFSVFRRKSTLLKSPSREDDEWLRDMVPLGRENIKRSGSSAVTSAQTSQDSTPPSSSEQSRATLSPRSSMYPSRSWSSPSTPTVIPVDLQSSDLQLPDARDTRV